MGNSRNQQAKPVITPIDPRGVPRAKVPYFIDIEPAAQVAAGATVTVTYTLGPRNFTCTHLGWTTQGVGFPAAGVDFKINVLDVGMSTFWAPFRWLPRAIGGNNPATSDNAAFELGASWTFQHGTSIQVEFENIGALNCLPYVVLHGYLD
jgi:hypothetical protein